MVSNRDLLFQGSIFRCHISFLSYSYSCKEPNIQTLPSLKLTAKAAENWWLGAYFQTFLLGPCLFLGSLLVSGIVDDNLDGW